MSNQKLRTDKTCLNCGNQVEERFCTHCGQENIEFHDSTWHMLVHYVQDLFHYDGRTLHTLKTLFRKPGLVAQEYIQGKRKSNIEPIKFYILSSTVFFLVLFTLAKPNENNSGDPRQELNKRIYYLQKEKKLNEGTADTLQTNLLLESLNRKVDSLNLVFGDTIKRPLGTFDLGQDYEGELDTIHWAWRAMVQKGREIQERTHGDENAFAAAVMEEFLHTFPQVFFLSLPFFAAFLKLVYYNRRKTYVEHLIFGIYQYGFIYACLIVVFLLRWLVRQFHSATLNSLFIWIFLGVSIYFLVYLFLSMRRFYGGKKRFLVWRFLLLLCLMSFILLLLILLLGSMAILFG